MLPRSRSKVTLSKIEQEALEIMESLTDRDFFPVFMSSKRRGIISDNFLTKGRDSRLGQESKESLPDPLPKPKNPRNE